LFGRCSCGSVTIVFFSIAELMVRVDVVVAVIVVLTSFVLVTVIVVVKPVCMAVVVKHLDVTCVGLIKGDVLTPGN
jgi:hypothetical protein